MSRDLGTIMNCGEGTQPSVHTKHPGSQNRSRGLTPEIFWSSRSTLLSTPRRDLESVIVDLTSFRTSRESESMEPGRTSALRPVHFIRGRLLSADISELPNPLPPLSPIASKISTRRLAYVLIAHHSPGESSAGEDEDLGCQHILRMSLPVAVSAHPNFLLYTILPRAIPFVGKHLTAGDDICVACPTGKNLGAGVIVTALSLFFGDDGGLLHGDDIDNKGEPTREGPRGLLIECTPRTNDRQIHGTKATPVGYLEQPESQPLQEHPQTGK